MSPLEILLYALGTCAGLAFALYAIRAGIQCDQARARCGLGVCEPSRANTLTGANQATAAAASEPSFWESAQYRALCARRDARIAAQKANVLHVHYHDDRRVTYVRNELHVHQAPTQAATVRPAEPAPYVEVVDVPPLQLPAGQTLRVGVPQRERAKVRR